MFINLSNHALQNWSLKQKEEAEKYGELIDLPFPNISPYADSVEIDRLVEKYLYSHSGWQQSLKRQESKWLRAEVNGL